MQVDGSFERPLNGLKLSKHTSIIGCDQVWQSYLLVVSQSFIDT